MMPNSRATGPWLEARAHVGTLNGAVKTEDTGTWGQETEHWREQAGLAKGLLLKITSD